MSHRVLGIGLACVIASSLHCGRAVSDGTSSACGMEGCGGASPEPMGSGGSAVSSPEPGEDPVSPCEVSDSLFAGSQLALESARGCTELETLAIEVFPDFDPEPLASLRRVKGSVFLMGGGKLPVTDPLRFLEGIEQVGSLILQNLEIESLSPLQGMVIREELVIEACPGFTTLEGFGPVDLETVRLHALPELRSLSGLEGRVSSLNVVDTGLSDLDSLGIGVEQLVVTQNQELVSLRGLESASRLLHVEGNPRLIEMVAPAAGAWAGELHIANNASLSHLGGLESLREVSQLTIRSNAALQSLEGLHALERAGTLELSGNPALVELSGLRSLVEVGVLQISGTDPLAPSVSATAPQPLASFVGLAALRRASTLDVRESPGVSTLAGLERVDMDSLTLTNNPNLVSLDGVSAEAGIDYIFISSCPALVDIDAFEPLASVGTLEINHTDIREVDALGNLRHAGSLVLEENPALAQVDGLANLNSADHLQLRLLPALRALPTFSNWVRGGNIRASELESLEVGPSFPVLVSSDSFTFDKNPLLQSLDLPALERVGTLIVERNQSLATLELPSLVEAELLYVRGNASLAAESLAALSSVNVSDERLVGGGALAPCPWTLDGTCDEATGACAAGSDSDCP